MQNFGFWFRTIHSSNWKIGFSFAAFLYPWRNHFAGKRHDMFVSRQNKFDWKFKRDYTKRWHVLIEQVHPQYFSGCKSIYMGLVVLDYFNNWNHQPYLWHNSIPVYLMNIISVLTLLQHIFALFFNLLLQTVL